MDDQLLAEVEQLLSSGLAPEMIMLRLLPLLTGRQNGEHIYSAFPYLAGMGCPGHYTCAFIWVHQSILVNIEGVLCTQQDTPVLMISL